MSSAGVVITKQILARHGARPDLRLWRNETAGAWVGKKTGTTSHGGVVLAKGSRMIKAGLAPGSSDLIGVGPGGKFLAIEVKAPGDRIRPEQKAFIACVLADVDFYLGPPP